MSYLSKFCEYKESSMSEVDRDRDCFLSFGRSEEDFRITLKDSLSLEAVVGDDNDKDDEEEEGEMVVTSADLLSPWVSSSGEEL